MSKIRFYYLIKIQFLGYRFHGWQKQPNQKTIHLMIDKLIKGPKQLKIISISFSLSEYSKSYQTIQSVDVRYPWGKTTAYLNKLKDEKC